MKLPAILLCVASMLMSSPLMTAQTTTDSPEEAAVLLKTGQVQAATDMLNRLEAKSPKNGEINMLLASCALAANDSKAAIEQLKAAQKKGINEAWLSLAEIAAREYRIEDAEADIELYRKGLKKGRKTLPDESENIVEIIDRTKNMLDRVEKIVIVDSLCVPVEDFFTYYRLSPESGTLTSPSTLPHDFEPASPTVVYTSESGMEQLYAVEDTAMTFKLASSALLYGGEREKPQPLNGDLNEGGDANYPFLMPDGITLYYANDGENSLGGYDIFITRKSGLNYLQPQNVGMPYNSPYNDYLLAIDEVTGAGWWATDRNHIPGMLTIYVFIPSDMRTNYTPDDPNLVSFARIDSYKDTWAPDADYSDLLAKIKAIVPSSARSAGPQFEFYIPGRGYLTSLDSFKSKQAANSMGEYLKQADTVDSTKKQLAELRQQYSDGNKSASSKILELEKRLTRETTRLKNMRNNIIRLESER